MKKTLSESIINNLQESEQDPRMKELSESIENILSQCNATISYVDNRDGEISFSCKFKADKLSQYDNDVSLYGRLFFDENLKLIKSDVNTSSGPNVLNYDFIKALNALYSYFSSGNNHYDL